MILHIGLSCIVSSERGQHPASESQRVDIHCGEDEKWLIVIRGFWWKTSSIMVLLILISTAVPSSFSIKIQTWSQLGVRLSVWYYCVYLSACVSPLTGVWGCIWLLAVCAWGCGRASLLHLFPLGCYLIHTLIWVPGSCYHSDRAAHQADTLPVFPHFHTFFTFFSTYPSQNSTGYWRVLYIFPVFLGHR